MSMERGTATGSTSMVSKEVKLEGEIQGSENLQVEGRFKGTIKLAGDLYIGPTGVVDADIEADNVVVHGQLNGNVLARKQLQIHSSGKLVGDCTASSIDIKEGALFEGRSKMIRSSASTTGTAGGSSTMGVKS
jgi:cytoskeletal protein CcmA (bactofilin family)